MHVQLTPFSKQYSCVSLDVDAELKTKLDDICQKLSNADSIGISGELKAKPDEISNKVSTPNCDDLAAELTTKLGEICKFEQLPCTMSVATNDVPKAGGDKAQTQLAQV